MMRESEAKGEHSIAKNNTHHRSVAHTDHRFCQQGPTQMEPASGTRHQYMHEEVKEKWTWKGMGCKRRRGLTR